tara:strand:- start:1461 stop:3200 length:1740 start_codon:yes stop_codon:yes gene_type:complete
MAEVGGLTGDTQPYIKLSDLEFSDVRKSLKEFLIGSGKFTDYDFEGSALSTLLDLLAYNSSLYGFYANMIANESFLDTAQTEEAIYSIVKPLSYLPVSRRGAKAQVTCSGSGVEIKPGDLITGGGLKWTPSRTYYIDGDTSVEIYQGQWVEQFVDSYDTRMNHQKFPIGSDFVDTTTLEVWVNETGAGGSDSYGKLWKRVEDYEGNITGLTSGSPVYFLTTSTDGRYSFYFGDGFVGKKPTDMSQIWIKYYETSGAEGNDTVTFISGIPAVSVTGTEIAGVGGAYKEDIESVRNNAPLWFQTQGRYVTAQDHRVGLLQERSGIVANVWGGEDNDPPNYGRVYVSALGNEGGSLTDETRNDIVSVMKNKGVVTILPEFVDPIKIDLSIRGNVFYDQTITGSPVGQIRGLIADYVYDYLQNEFNTTFNFPIFSVGLTQLSAGIVGDTLTIYLEKEIEYEGEPILAVSLPLRNQLADSGGLPGTVVQTPSPFLRINQETLQPQLAYLIDDGFGGLKLYEDGTGSIIGDVGSVDYNNGSIHIDNLHAIESFVIEVRPKSNTILALGPNLLTTKDGGIEVVEVT